MYVVGAYILVEPFDLEKEGIIDMGEKKLVSLVGKVVSVGKDAEEYIKVGTIVHLTEGPGHCPTRVGRRLFFRTILQNITVCYDNMKEYKKTQRDEKALRKAEAEKQSNTKQLIIPQGAIHSVN